MIDYRKKSILYVKVAVAVTGAVATSFAVTETTAKALGFPETDVLLAVKRGWMGSAVVAAIDLATPIKTAPDQVWDMMCLPAFMTASGALLLEGFENINLADVAKQSIRIALIGSPIWIGFWSLGTREDARRQSLRTTAAPGEPAPPYRP